MDQLSILVKVAPFPLENIEKIIAFDPNVPTTRNSWFSNETVEITSRLGDYSIPTHGQLPEFSSNPASIFEAANNSRKSIKALSTGGTKQGFG